MPSNSQPYSQPSVHSQPSKQQPCAWLPDPASQPSAASQPCTTFTIARLRDALTAAAAVGGNELRATRYGLTVYDRDGANVGEIGTDGVFTTDDVAT